MSLVIAVDPGKRTGGVALFLDGRLLRAEVICVGKAERPEDFAKLFGEEVRELAASASLDFERMELICEDQVVRTAAIMRGKHKADPQDLLWLSKTVGACEMALEACKCFRVNPEDWKSNMDPDVLLQRIRNNRLEPAEQLIWDGLVTRFGKSSAHHAQDAIGIGLFHLGRIKRGGVA